MGAWGRGAFENDGALDFLAAFAAEGVPRLISAFTLLPPDYIEVDQGEAVVAGAEIVAAAWGRPGPDLPEDARQLALGSASLIRAVPGLPQLALKALARVVIDGSELHDLWAEYGEIDQAEELDAWLADMADLQFRLRVIAAEP